MYSYEHFLHLAVSLVFVGGGTLFPLLSANVQNPVSKSQVQASDAVTHDLLALIRASDRKGAAMHQRLIEFTYIQRRIEREKDSKGKMIEQVREFEAYPIKAVGRQLHVLSLIKKDGVPVSEQQLEQNRQYAAREMEQAERENSPTEQTGGEKYITAGIGIGPAGEGVWLGVSSFLRQCQFETPRAQQLNGRDSIALTFYSCSNLNATERESYLTQMTGILWIDIADQVVARLEAWPFNDTRPLVDVSAARPAEAPILYEQQLVRNGIWAPRRIRLNGIGNAKLFNGVNKDMIFEFTDYRHFSTDVKEKEIIEQPKKPS